MENSIHDMILLLSTDTKGKSVDLSNLCDHTKIKVLLGIIFIIIMIFLIAISYRWFD